jgi:porin
MTPAGRLAAAILWVVVGCLFLRPVAASGQAPGHPGLSPFSSQELEAEAKSWFEQPYLTGNWGGLRTRLRDMGITPSLTFFTDVQGNPVGGETHGFRESSNWGLDVTMDMDKLADLKGSQFHVSFALRSGTSLTDEDIGNVFNVAQTCCQHTYWLVNVDWQQRLFGDLLELRGGRIAAGDDFMTSPLYGYFLQSGIDGNTGGIFFNVPMTVYPTATWGIRARVMPIPQIYVMAGVYNGDPTLVQNEKHGVDWTMRGPLFAMGEVGFRLNQEPGATGLPGNYKVGGYYAAGDYPDLYFDVQGGAASVSGLPPLVHRGGNGGFYFLLDQTVYQPGGPESRRGLIPFLSLLFAPDTSINTMPFFLNGGLVYRGPFASRPHDRAAFGVVYGSFSNELARSQRASRRAGSAVGIQSYELVLELTYRFQLTGWLRMQPNVQYIINPGATGSIPDALVVGFQLSVNF